MNVIIFGATGSIGDTFFSILRKKKNSINVIGATCNKNFKKIAKLQKEFNIPNIGINDKKNAIKYSLINKKAKTFIGIESFSKMIHSKVDIIIFSISGLSALDLSLIIASSGKTIGLANKESIISLGYKFIKIAKKNKSKIVPLDSEHFSIYRLLKLNKKNELSKITITASGGPFYKMNLKFIKKVTPNQALKHPIWKMGKKISVDSATMMNKALELIEAKFLFDLEISQLNAVIHPESVIHASINYKDGTTTCLMYEPDMKIPISNLFNEFKKDSFDNNCVDFVKINKFHFLNINEKKYPAIKLCYEVLRKGGIAPHIFNYNNEILVNKFLERKIKFLDIVNYNKITLDNYFAKNKNITNPSILNLKEANKWIDSNIFLG